MIKIGDKVNQSFILVLLESTAIPSSAAIPASDTTAPLQNGPSSVAADPCLNSKRQLSERRSTRSSGIKPTGNYTAADAHPAARLPPPHSIMSDILVVLKITQ